MTLKANIESRGGYLPSFESAWQLILGKVVDERTSEALKTMFCDPDRLNDFSFSQIHTRVLELDGHRSIDLISEKDTDTDTDAVDMFGRTSLHWAIERNDFGAVTKLLEMGADPNVRATYSGWTSMHFVARARTVDRNLLAALVDYGAQPNALDCNNQTPLSRAIRHNDSAAKIRILAEMGANVNLQYDETRWSVSHLAMFLCHHESIRVLLECGADFSLRTIAETNVLQFAAKYGDIEMIKLLQGFSSVLVSVSKSCRGIPLADLQEFRRDKNIILIDDKWWSAWMELIGDNIVEPCDLDISIPFEDALEFL